MKFADHNYSIEVKQSYQKSAVLSGLILGLLLSGCNSTPVDRKTNNQKTILTTFTVVADMAQNVAGDKAIVASLVKTGSEIHSYQPTPSDLVKAQQADLILDNGLNLERWAEKLYNNVPKVPHITISKGVKTIKIGEDTYQGKPNPHAWMSPQNALIYVENIRQALVDLDPANQKTYNLNAKAYSQKIEELDRKLKKVVATIPPQKRYIVSCEGAFSYLSRDYDLKEVYLWSVNSERQGSPKQVEKVIDIVKANQIPVVFCESTVNSEVQQQVVEETGAKFGGVFYVDSLSAADGEAPTYLKLLEHNIFTLIDGLQEKSN